MNVVLVNGFFVGLIYGMLALGLAVAYRGSRVINFAYGETGVIGAFVYAEIRLGRETLVIPNDHGLWLSLPIGIAVSACLGALTELLIVRPLRRAPRIRPLVGTFAIGILFFTFAGRRWGLDARQTRPLIEGSGIEVGGLRIAPQQLLILAVCAVVVVGIWLLYRFTPFGLQMRAVAIDPYAAGLSGVNVNRTSLLTWALVGAISGTSAILISPLVGFTVAFMTTLSIRGLAAAVLGGLGNPAGAFLAGIALGVAEGVIAYKSPVSGITEVVVAVLVLAVVALRPSSAAEAAA